LAILAVEDAARLVFAAPVFALPAVLLAADFACVAVRLPAFRALVVVAFAPLPAAVAVRFAAGFELVEEDVRFGAGMLGSSDSRAGGASLSEPEARYRAP
jgi:hypothetical protein